MEASSSPTTVNNEAAAIQAEGQQVNHVDTRNHVDASPRTGSVDATDTSRHHAAPFASSDVQFHDGTKTLDKGSKYKSLRPTKLDIRKGSFFDRFRHSIDGSARSPDDMQTAPLHFSGIRPNPFDAQSRKSTDPTADQGGSSGHHDASRVRHKSESGAHLSRSASDRPKQQQRGVSEAAMRKTHYRPSRNRQESHISTSTKARIRWDALKNKSTLR